MSIFESKPQVFRRKVREGFGKFFGEIGNWFRKMNAEFRSLPKGARTSVYIGGSMLAVLLVFAIAVWPMLQRPEPGVDGPQRETVAEAIDRLDDLTQGNITEENMPELIEDIDEQIFRTEDDQEIVQLYILKYKTYFNAGQYYDAVKVGKELEEKNILTGKDKFTVYSGLVFACEKIDDLEQRRHYAQLVLNEYANGTIEDMGSMQYYVGVANGYF